MTFSPCCRIVQAVLSPALRLRGLGALVQPYWPQSNIGAGADYSVDFGALMCGGEYVVECTFGLNGNATQAWTSIFGNVATAWLTWTTSGNVSISVAVRTNLGNVYQVDVGIYLSQEAALITPVPPDDPNGGEPTPSVDGAVLSRSGNPVTTRNGAYLAFRTPAVGAEALSRTGAPITTRSDAYLTLRS